MAITQLPFIFDEIVKSTQHELVTQIVEYYNAFVAFKLEATSSLRSSSISSSDSNKEGTETDELKTLMYVKQYGNDTLSNYYQKTSSAPLSLVQNVSNNVFNEVKHTITPITTTSASTTITTNTNINTNINANNNDSIQIDWGENLELMTNKATIIEPQANPLIECNDIPPTISSSDYESLNQTQQWEITVEKEGTLSVFLYQRNK
jgi:hypothetical protein